VKQYSTIVMDPPWWEHGGGKSVRGAQRHYRLLKTRDMPAVIYGSGMFNPAPDCHLYVWTTANFLPDAIWLIDALGFKYVTNAVWLKPGKAGLGQYFRMQHEHLLLATRGQGYNVRTDARNLGSIVSAARTEHSRKPPEAYELIEARSHGPRLDMFAREERTGWDVWGDECP
jgi:N6-adenosine-specific RNA methylase IME4